ncbi:MAG: metallophosphoesterase family protein [Candidatus Bipolaricaulota bacterium]
MTLVSFLHTADWQLGQTLKALEPAKAEELRAARLETVDCLLQVAEDHEVDFLLSAGDTFESNQVDRKLLQKTRRVLKDHPHVPIYIIPGNHDPLREDYPFNSDIFGDIDQHVHVLREEKPVEVSGCSAVIYPGICTRKQSSTDPLGWIPVENQRENIRIGLAHGTWQIKPDLPADEYPIEENAASRHKLDYLALGHWHSTNSGPAEAEGRTYYAGTPEPTGFKEKDSGNVLLVEIESPGARPRVNKIHVGKYHWIQQRPRLSDLTSVEKFTNQLSADNPESDRTLLNIQPEGTVPFEVQEAFRRAQEALEDQYYFVKVRNSELNLVPSEDEIQELSSGTGWLAPAVKYLEKLAAEEVNSAPENWKMEEAPGPEEAQRALEIIYSELRREEEQNAV